MQFERKHDSVGRYDRHETFNQRVLEFDSWGEFVAEATRESDCTRRSSREPASYDSDFFGDAEWEDTVKLANEGWVEKISDVDLMMDHIRDELKVTLEKHMDPYWDVMGINFNVDRFLEGEPDCVMNVRPIEVSKQGRVISLLVSCSASAFVKQEKLMQRGLAICGLIEALRYMQHGVELWVEQTVTSGKDMLSTLVRVKEATEPMDMGRVIFAVAHPTMLRRMVFSIEENQPYEWRSRIGIGDAGSGYGMPHKLACADLVNASIELEPLQHPYFECDEPEAWIRENLTKWGIIQEGE